MPPSDCYCNLRGTGRLTAATVTGWSVTMLGFRRRRLLEQPYKSAASASRSGRAGEGAGKRLDVGKTKWVGGQNGDDIRDLIEWPGRV